MNIKQRLLENPDELRRLYVDEELTARQIGELHDCSKRPVLDALAELGIERRHTRTNGTKPTCQQLRQWVEIDHLTLAEMARRTGAHYTGVRWWVKQCDIEWKDPDAWTQRNLQRGLEKPTKKQLMKWYLEDEMSLEVIAKEIGASRGYIISCFDEYGLETRAPGWSHKTFECDDGHVVKSTYELRVDNWLHSNGLEHVYEFPLSALGGTGSADFRVDGVFIEVWGVMDSRRYDRRKEVKTRWYAKNNHRLISINHWDFAAQTKGLWKRKLQALLLS